VALNAQLTRPGSRLVQHAGTVCLIAFFSLGLFPASALAQDPTPEELIAWLDDPTRAWIATAHLQATPDAAQRLLRSGRVVSGHHDEWTAPMLALAKLGEPAIALITERAIGMLDPKNGTNAQAVHSLLTVLGSMGPPAVPALIRIADASVEPLVVFDALDQIVGLEPPAAGWHLLSPWGSWTPADDRLDALRRALVPLLPRVLELVERSVAEWTPGRTAPQRPGAYLLARWGSGNTRLRGLQLLDTLSRLDDEPFYYNLDSIRLLHRLGAPQTAGLVHRAAARVPARNALRAQYLLQMAITLHQLGDRAHAPLLAVALGDERPHVRMDAAEFVGVSGELSLAPLLLPLLGDVSEWNGRTVARVALHALQRLTFEQFGADADEWRVWFDTHRNSSRATIVAQRVNERRSAVRRAPMWDVNRWVGEFEATDGAALFPLLDPYLARTDLNTRATGPNSAPVTGGTGHPGMSGPRIVTLLLEMTMRGVPGAIDRLRGCLNVVDPDVRVYGALALGAFDRPRAVERLATEMTANVGHRRRASDFLLRLGDKRGIASLLDELTHSEEVLRRSACRDLRSHTQQTLPCDSRRAGADPARDAAAWRAWWERAASTFVMKGREAALDRLVLSATPVSFGSQPVR
jgi:hypothetical protein